MVRPFEHGLFAAIVDVLGHGTEAHELACVIDAFLDRHASADIGGLMQRLHQSLKGTRGAAVGLCVVNSSTRTLDFVGIGNTSIRRFGKSETRLVSRDGVVGQNMRTPLLQSLELEPGDMIVLTTDGVSDRFTAVEYPSIPGGAPKDVARIVVDRFGKNHDDCACIVIRYRE